MVGKNEKLTCISGGSRGGARGGGGLDRPPPYLRVRMTGSPLSEGLDPSLCMTFLCMIVRRKNKTVAHTFLPSFDNANGHLCQVRLL